MSHQTSARVTAVLALALAVLGTFVVLPGTSALAADASEDQLIFATPEAQAVPMPAPGGSVLLTSTVSNVSDASLQVHAALELDPADPLAAPGSPLTIAFSIDGKSPSDAVPLADAVDAPLPIDALAPRESVQVEATISMSREAGNEWAGRSTEAVLHYTAQSAEPSEKESSVPDGALALTGMVGIGLLIVIAALSVALAVALLWRGARRERPTHDGPAVHLPGAQDEETR